MPATYPKNRNKIPSENTPPVTAVEWPGEKMSTPLSSTYPRYQTTEKSCNCSHSWNQNVHACGHPWMSHAAVCIQRAPDQRLSTLSLLTFLVVVSIQIAVAKAKCFLGYKEFHVRFTFSCSNLCDMTNSMTEICEVKSAAARVVGMTVLVYPAACAGMNLKTTTLGTSKTTTLDEPQNNNTGWTSKTTTLDEPQKQQHWMNLKNNNTGWMSGFSQVMLPNNWSPCTSSYLIRIGKQWSGMNLRQTSKRLSANQATWLNRGWVNWFF